MKKFIAVMSLATAFWGPLPSLALAAPTTASAQNFPEFTEFNCTPLFDEGASTAEQGRISCARSDNTMACVVGENPLSGSRAALRLANETRLSSRDGKGTYGAMIIRGDRGVIAGTTKAASRAQQGASIGRAYTKADAVIVPAVESVAGFFVKATLIVPIRLGAHQYEMQDSNFIVGRNPEGETYFYAIVTPENDVVVQYIDTDRQGGLKCSNLPSEILGRYLVAPGIVFSN